MSDLFSKSSDPVDSQQFEFFIYVVTEMIIGYFLEINQFAE